MGRVDGESAMLMPIGRFARASRLSVKSLRNYDESGLLPAAVVDPESGYRYYRVEQLARADAIRSLRMVEMPLPLIAEALESDDPESLLMSHLEALENQRIELERKALELKRRIDTKDYTMSTTVSIKTNEKKFADLEAGSTILIPSPQDIEAEVNTLGTDDTLTLTELRNALAERHGAQGCCPVMTGMNLRVAAEVTFDALDAGVPTDEMVPIWKAIEPSGTLAPKLSGGIDRVQALRAG